MEPQDLTPAIMKEIAHFEQFRIKKVLAGTIFALVSLSGILVFLVNRTVFIFLDDGIRELFAAIELDKEILLFTATDIANVVKEELNLPLIALFTASTAVIVYVSRKTHFRTLFKRLKQTSHYTQSTQSINTSH